MAETDTGLLAYWGISGTNRIHELTRQGVRVLAEVTNEAVASTVDPITVDILRRQVTVPGNPMGGIPDAYADAAGLTDLLAVVFTQATWNDRQIDPALRLKEGERIVLLPDVPAAGGEDAYEILPTDRCRLDDPVYGLQVFEIMTVDMPQGPGTARLKVKYAREAGA